MNSLPNLRSIIASVTMVMILFLSSCSNEENTASRSQLLGLIGNDALVIGSVDPAAILASAGAKVDGGDIVLPDNFNRMAKNGNKAVKALTELTSAKGVDYHSLVFSATADDYTILFAIKNASKFASWAKDKGMVQETIEQYQVFTGDENVAIVVDNDVAWLIVDPENAAEAAEKVNTKAKAALANPTPQWIVERLTKGDAAFIVDPKSMIDAVGGDFKQSELDYTDFYNQEYKYFAFDCKFDGPSLKLTGHSYSADGKLVDMLPDGSYEPISTKALSLVKDSQIAMAFSFPDNWKKIYESVYKMNGMNYNPEYVDAVSSSFDAIKSISLGASLREGATIATLTPTDIKATAAIAYDKSLLNASAKKWVNIAKDGGFEASLANGWKAWNEDSTFIIAPVAEFPDFKIYFTGRDDLALISTDAAISKTDITPASSLDNLVGFFSVDIKKNNPILQMVACPFGIKIYGTSNASMSECEFTLTDCDGLFLESIIGYASRF